MTPNNFDQITIGGQAAGRLGEWGNGRWQRKGLEAAIDKFKILIFRIHTFKNKTSYFASIETSFGLTRKWKFALGLKKVTQLTFGQI